MRRTDLQVTDKKALLEIIRRCRVCRLGIAGDPPYIVPMNFGYAWDEGLTLYFHSAPEGRKIDLLVEHPHVAFEMDCDHALIEGDTACRYTFRYASLTGEGNVRFIEAYEEKLLALRAIMRRLTGSGEHFYDEPAVRAVAVFALDAARVIGKRR